MEEEVLSRKKPQCWQSLAPCGQGQHKHCAAMQSYRMGILAVGRHLCELTTPTSAQSRVTAKASCPGGCPGTFWVSPRMVPVSQNTALVTDLHGDFMPLSMKQLSELSVHHTVLI